MARNSSRRLLPFLLLLAACVASTPDVSNIRRTGSGAATGNRPEVDAAEHERFDDPDLALEYEALKRTGTDDIHRAYAVAREAMRRMPRYATNGDTLLERRAFNAASTAEPQPFRKWQFLGPGNIGGRTRAILIDPADPNVMYAAGVSGGIWKSLNAGGLWAPIADDLANIAVNSMVMHPTDRQTIYAGTGEGYFREVVRGTALPLRGNGIFVTHDGGATWTQLASTANENFHFVNDLVISTHDSSRIYAATRTGVWLSRDGGETWTRSLATTVNGGCLDLAWRGNTSGDYLFASCGTLDQATVYRNTNASGGAEWQSVLSDPQMGRTTLAIAPSNPSIIYALSATNVPGRYTQGLHAVWRSDANGDPGSWNARVDAATKTDVIAPHLLTNLVTVDNEICKGAPEEPTTMGWYCNTIAVDPVDPERVWVGSVDLFRSDDGGRNWGVASYWWAEDEPDHAFVHADQHLILFHPQYNGTTNRTVYFGNDGGVFRTDNALAPLPKGKAALCLDSVSQMKFVSLDNSYGVTQFYHGAVSPDGRTFIAGAQDNGTLLGRIDEGQKWKRIFGGDGGYVAIDPNNPLFLYVATQNGNVFYTANGEVITNSFRPPADYFLFITPYTIDPNKLRTVWLGGTALWRVVNGSTTWTQMSAPMPGSSRVSAIALATSDRMIAGTSTGYIVRSDSASSSTKATVWASARPREGFVSSVAYDPVDNNVVYATYAGFGGKHVWKSTDAGATWTSIDGTGDAALPDIPAHSLAVDPTRRERLYLGTDLGVFVSLDGGAHWAIENSGFATVVTEAVVIAQGASGPAVYAFTHGRGAWRAELTLGGPKRRGVRH
ncbi:MAG: hypothetical protein M3Q69_08665 [Acidobacteriota bacterium]|nr:hypothetical protein [Acidobacteriota bacterium]